MPNTRAETEYACVENTAIDRATITGPWTFDVRVNQLSAGKFYSKLEYVRTPDMMLYEQYWSRSVEVRGFSPRSCIMLGANVSDSAENFEWCGKTLGHQRFACSPPGGEIDFKTPLDSRHIVMLVKAELLEKAVGRKLVAQLISQRFIDFTRADSKRLVAAIKSIIRAFSVATNRDADPISSGAIKSMMIDTLNQCLRQSKFLHSQEPVSSWKQAVRSALTFVENHNGPVTALELAKATGVSQRTMEYAFRNQMGITPARYLRVYRLNAAHRDLASANPDLRTVTQIAYQWGFNHPGRFSLAHRQLFGETPVEVLKRNSP